MEPDRRPRRRRRSQAHHRTSVSLCYEKLRSLMQPYFSSCNISKTHEEAAELSRALQELPVECDVAQRFTAGSQMNAGLDQPEDGSYRIPQSWFLAGSAFGFLSDGVCDTSQLLQCTESFEDDEL
ncbi:unnamed protein product [Lampetra fluviatilis]